jgi:hypothetical protein
MHGELFPFLDSPDYFTEEFTKYLHDINYLVSCKYLEDENCDPSNANDKRNVEAFKAVCLTRPGILLPVFLGKWILRLSDTSHTCDNKNAIKIIILGIVRSICGDCVIASTKGNDISLLPMSSSNTPFFAKSTHQINSFCALKWFTCVFSLQAVRSCLMNLQYCVLNVGELHILSNFIEVFYVIRHDINFCFSDNNTI